MANIGTVGTHYSQISKIDFFLVQPTDSKSAAVPVALIKGPPALSTELNDSLLGLVKFENSGEWIVAGPAGKNPVAEWDQIVSSAKKQAQTPPPTTFYVKVDDAQAVGQYMQANPILKGMLLGKLPTGLLVDELGSIDNIEIRGSPNGDKTRIVLILKARPSTMLYTLFSQRMPIAPPEEHKHISVEGAQSYGYCLFNSKITAAYLLYLSDKTKDRKEQLSAELSNEAAAIQQAWGYLASVRMPEENGCRLFFRGKWDTDDAAKFVTATDLLLHSRVQKAGKADNSPGPIKNAFWIDQTPIYKISFGKPDAGNTAGRQIFFAVRENGLATATSAESITDFVQNIEAETAGATMGSAFTSYPTLFTQWKVDADTLMESASMGAWAPARKSGYIYGACQLIKGQAAMTLDVPSVFFDNFAKFIREQSQSTPDEKDPATPHAPKKSTK